MARDSIELTQYDDVVSTSRGRSVLGLKPKASNGDDPKSSAKSRSAASRRVSAEQDDSELFVNREDLNPEDLDLDELDNEEAQFLRTDRRVPVRRSAIPKKAASQLKIAGAIAAAMVICGGVTGGGFRYCMDCLRCRHPISRRRD